MKSVRNVILTLGISLVALIAGCVSYQPPPSVIHADTYTGVDSDEQRALPSTSKILTKEEAITIALENNPDYKTYQLNKIAAFATYYAALSAFSPTVSAGWSVAQRHNGTSGNSGGSGTDYNGGLSAGYSSFNFFTTSFGALGSRAGAMASEWNVKDYRRQLVRNVIIDYNAVLKARADFLINQANERFQEQNATNSLLKYNAGADSLSNLLNFKVGRNGAKADAIASELDYKIARYVLASDMGLTTADLPPGTEFPEISVLNEGEFELGVEFYLDIAIAERPDLKSTRQTLQAAKYNLYSSWGAFSPTMNLGLNWGYDTGYQTGSGSNNVDMPVNGYYNWNFGANWDLWKGGSRIFNVRNAEALYDASKQSLLKQWITIVKEVRTYYVSLLANVARRKVLEEARTMAQQRRDLVQEEYDAGNVDIAVLNQAQQDLVTSRQKYVQATIDVSNSRAQLYAAVGVNQ